MSEPVKIAIIIEGGCLGAVLTAGVPVEFVLIDYDVGDNPGVPVIQSNGTTEKAEVSTGTAEAGGQFVLDAFALADMPIWRVVLAAHEVTVTGSSEAQAARYAKADGREFIRQHNYTVARIDETAEDAQAADEAEIDVQLERPPVGKSDCQHWDFTVLVTINVAAPTSADAPAAAKRILQIETEIVCG